MSVKLEQNDFLDMVKFSLALMIVLLHSGARVGFAGHDLLWPWLRMAVPLFFMISSYLLFSRVGDGSDGGATLKKFVRRNVMLYCGWFVILLPIIVWRKHAVWFSDGGLLTFLRSVFLGSTFTASWFISALVLATVLVYFLSRHVNDLVLIAIGLLSFCWCTIISSYGSVVAGMPILSSVNAVMSAWNPSPQFSFMAALFWVAVGRFFAVRRVGWIANRGFHLVLLVLFAACLWVEWRSVWHWTGQAKNDCYFALVPFCVVLFQLLLNCHCSFRLARELRAFSVVIFVLHGSLLGLIPRNPLKYVGVLEKGWLSDWCRVLVCLIVCFAAWRALILLQRRFAWVKFLF